LVNVSSAVVMVVTVAVHHGSEPPDEQFDPADDETIVFVRDWLPVAGLLTVTV